MQFECFVSSQGWAHDLFRMFEILGYPILAMLVPLLATKRTRSIGTMIMLGGIVGAATLTPAFHFCYALPIWRNHNSAVQMLDTRAALVGFAAGSLVCSMAIAVGSAIRRVRRFKDAASH